MPLAEKALALLTGLSLADVQAMPPARRRSFAQLCRHWWMIAENMDAPNGTRSGVLADLDKNGGRGE